MMAQRAHRPDRVRALGMEALKNGSVNENYLYMKNYIVITLFTIIALSCSRPLDKKYNEETFNEDVKKIDTAHVKLIFATAWRYTLENKEINGLTYRQLLDEGTKYKIEQDSLNAEAKALAERAARDEAERIRKLKDALTVTIFAKGFDKGNIRSYISYKFAFENKTPKDIRAFTGQIIFNDLFDREISRMNVTYDKIVKARSKTTWEAQTKFNEFDADDVALAGKSLDNLKVVWQPEKILLAGGSYLE
jgi:hypothetical protein